MHHLICNLLLQITAFTFRSIFWSLKLEIPHEQSDKIILELTTGTNTEDW